MPFIYGGVKDSVTNVLISNAVVSCPTATVTNNQGAYSMVASSDTIYQVTASATGYITQTAQITVHLSSVQKNFLLVAG